MAQSDTELVMNLAVEVEEREDRWVFYAPALALTVYTKRQEDGEGELGKAAKALLNRFEGDVPRLRRYLDNRGVTYSLTCPQEDGQKMSRQIEVPLVLAT